MQCAKASGIFTLAMCPEGSSTAQDPIAAGPATRRPLGNRCCHGSIYYQNRFVKLMRPMAPQISAAFGLQVRAAMCNKCWL
jgi:hypothetical protein